MEVIPAKEADRPMVSLTAPPVTVKAAPSSPPARHPARILAAGVVIGALFDFFVYGQRVGVGFTLVAVACVAALFAIYAGERQLGENEERVRLAMPNVAALTAAVLFFAAMASVRGGPILQAMNVAASVLLGCLLVHRFRARTCADLTMVELFFGPCWLLGVTVGESSLIVAAVQAQMPDRGRRAGIAKTAVRGVLLAALPLAVFVALLSSADPLFARGANAVVAWLFPTDFVLRLWRVGVASIVAILATGALATAVRRRQTSLPTMPPNSGDVGPRGVIGIAESMMVLIPVCAVFGAFVAIQFAYLFGGAGRVLAVPGLTYAEYARSGFNELVWVAVLALTLISVLHAATRLPTKSAALTAFRVAATGLIGMTLIVLLSAVQRMNAYESAYGVTATRLAVDTFIATLALALLWRAATLFIASTRPTFAIGLLVCAVGFCAAVDLQSPEAAAIRANTARYRATGKIDMDYLLGNASDEPRSVDAVPALCDALRDTKPGTPLHHRLRERLRETQKDVERDARDDAWTAANLSRRSARKALADALVQP